MTAIVWFRRDLRIHDNPALVAALQQHDVVVPFFCLDDRLLNGRHRSPARAAFMRACLVELDQELRARGSGLVIRHGRPEAEIPALASKLGACAVLAAEDVSPFARERDRLVALALESGGVQFEPMPGTFVADDLWSIRTGTHNPYTVFTPFHRKWLTEPRRGVEPTPSHLPQLPAHLDRGTLPEFGELPAEARCEPGESAARRQMRTFVTTGVQDYDKLHDAVGRHGTSVLSAHLHFGSISARELESELPQTPAAQALRRQLCWRDFYAHVLLHHPTNARVEHQARFRRRIRWTRSELLFHAWRTGQTGYPLVDAGMRELAATGWMHNRARMVVGSFLVKDLGIDWRWGERWFMRALIDGDEANNNGNWQWIASVGVDPQPPARRIFNPTLQQERFDPDGLYVRRHVPELASVPDRYLAEPWTMPEQVQREVGCVIGADYPAPIVDHAAARREALARYASALQAPG